MLQDTMHADGAEHGIDGFNGSRYRERILELEREVAQLREALTQRQQYGVVTGLVAAHFGLTPERAWQLLVRLSQRSNLKMRVVARVLHDRYCDQLAPEDKPLAAQLDAQLRGGLNPSKSPESGTGARAGT
jgi:hypothetical protein